MKKTIATLASTVLLLVAGLLAAQPASAYNGCPSTQVPLAYSNSGSVAANVQVYRNGVWRGWTPTDTCATKVRFSSWANCTGSYLTWSYYGAWRNKDAVQNTTYDIPRSTTGVSKLVTKCR